MTVSHTRIEEKDKVLLAKLALADRRSMVKELSWLIEQEMKRRSGKIEVAKEVE